MGILEMIPEEYWRQLFNELQTIDWAKKDEEIRLQQERERERRSIEYVEAIKRKQKEASRISHNKPESKARKREYQKKYWAKKKNL